MILAYVDFGSRLTTFNDLAASCSPTSLHHRCRLKLCNNTPPTPPSLLLATILSTTAAASNSVTIHHQHLHLCYLPLFAGFPQVGPPQEQAKPRETHKLLQVLGGTTRRKKLLSPKSMDVRPMMEVVKGATFGILQAAGGWPTSLRPGRWLDLYSGTGSVGIGAISRGCSQVHFVEMGPWVVSDVLRPNLEWTGFLDNSVIHTVRVETYFERIKESKGKDGPFGYISVTPPYMEVDYEILMKQIVESAVIGDDSFIVVEYPFRTDMLETCGCLIKIADRRFGRTNLTIYGPTWAQKKRKS